MSRDFYVYERRQVKCYILICVGFSHCFSSCLYRFKPNFFFLILRWLPLYRTISFNFLINLWGGLSIHPTCFYSLRSFHNSFYHLRIYNFMPSRMSLLPSPIRHALNRFGPSPNLLHFKSYFKWRNCFVRFYSTFFEYFAFLNKLWFL